MKTPKSGLKAMNDPVYEGPRLSDVTSLNAADLAEKLFLGPFKALGAVFSLQTLFSMVLVFLGTFVYSIVTVFAQANAVAASTDAFIYSVLLGLVAGSLFYVTTTWTYFDALPTLIYPAHAMSMVATSLTRNKAQSFGLVLALIYVTFQYCASLAAGGVLKLLGVTGALQNQATSASSYWMYWLGATVIGFSMVYNRLFKQEEEYHIATSQRAAIATAIAIFGMQVAFHSLGLNTYSSGVFLTQTVVANYAYPSYNATAAPNVAFLTDGTNQWAFYIFVEWLAVPATVFLLVILMSLVLQATTHVGKSKNEDSNSQVGASSSHSSDRLKKRNATVNVQY